MRKIYSIIGIFILTFISCDKDENNTIYPGRWEMKMVCTNPVLDSRDVTIFVMKDTIYWGFGYSSQGFNSCFYKLDMANGWEKASSIADFPFGGRQQAVIQPIGEKIYVGLGHQKPILAGLGSEEVYYKDFYIYDVANKSWSISQCTFPGQEREHAISFVDNGFLHVGGGKAINGDVLSDFYRLDVKTGIWESLKALPEGRYGCTTFRLNDEACIGCGKGYHSYPGYFIKWNGEEETWESVPLNSTEELNILRREAPAIFTLTWQGNENAYVVGGINDGGILKDSWKYDSDTNQWEQVADFPGIPDNPVAFTLRNRAFILTHDSRVTTLWEFVIE